MNPWEVDIFVPYFTAGRLIQPRFPTRPSLCTCIMTEERVKNYWYNFTLVNYTKIVEI